MPQFINTNVSSALFSDTAGDRGESITIDFVDANKDGNLTVADDIVLEVMGADPG